VSSDWIALALAVLTARWWWAVGAALLEDLRKASEPFEALPERARVVRHGPMAVGERSRVPLNRVLAFRGVARRVSSRRRWEGGFGRRGL
jgi:hypothetical protein